MGTQKIWILCLCSWLLKYLNFPSIKWNHDLFWDLCVRNDKKSPCCFLVSHDPLRSEWRTPQGCACEGTGTIWTYLTSSHMLVLPVRSAFPWHHLSLVTFSAAFWGTSELLGEAVSGPASHRRTCWGPRRSKLEQLCLNWKSQSTIFAISHPIQEFLNLTWCPVKAHNVWWATPCCILTVSTGFHVGYLK